MFLLKNDVKNPTITKIATARTFPQIKIDGESIGGYNEFERIILEHV